MRFIAVVLLFPAGIALAGPWTKNPGEAYVKLSESMFIAGDYVDPRARMTLNTAAVEHRSFTTALYAEAGVLENLHAQLYLPYVAGRNSYEGGGGYLSVGPGDLSISAQYTPKLLPFPHAARAELKIPLYDIAQPKGFEGTRFPARGDGQLDATIYLSAGDSLAEPRIYYFAELGHRFRTEAYVGEGDQLSFGDCFVFNGQLGWTTIFDLIVALNTSGVVPYANDRTTKGYVNVGASLFFPFAENFAAEATIDGTSWARASSHGLSISLGASYRL